MISFVVIAIALIWVAFGWFIAYLFADDDPSVGDLIAWLIGGAIMGPLLILPYVGQAIAGADFWHKRIRIKR